MDHHRHPTAKDIDERSSLVQSGDLIINEDGTIDQSSPAVLDGRVLVTEHGYLDERSSAYKHGSVKYKPTVNVAESHRM